VQVRIPLNLVCTYSTNDVECLEDLKRLLSYLPQSNKEKAHNLPYELNDEVRTKLATIIPDNQTNRTICTRLLVELLKRFFLKFIIMPKIS
jgi:acetyl-CoA carboxylase carboxyltransferase component